MSDKTIISSANELAEAMPLINKGRAYLAVGERKNGERWFRMLDRLDFTDAGEIMHEMAQLFAAELGGEDNVAHYSAAEISDKKEPVPEYATTPGYYDCSDGDLLLSAADEAAGIWGYSYDVTETRVILVSEISR